MHIGSVQVLEGGQELGDGPVFAIGQTRLREGELEAGGWRLGCRRGDDGGCDKRKQNMLNAAHDELLDVAA